MDFKWRPDRDTNPRFEVISLKRQAEIDATKRAKEEELAKQFHRPISSVEVLNEADELDMKQQNPNESANVTRRRHKLLDVNALVCTSNS
jgi:Asp-tRNA(Asn)/Glu-tRNA(Gln) amidotransferase C subunit